MLISFMTNLSKTGLSEISTDDLKQIASKDKKFNPIMALIKLLSDIFVPIIPALVAGGLLMALQNFLTAAGLLDQNQLKKCILRLKVFPQ